MEPDTDNIEQLLRKAVPRGLSPGRFAHITTTLGGTPLKARSNRRTLLLRFWPAAAAAAAAAVFSICAVHQTFREPANRSGSADYLPVLSQVTLLPRENLGRFVSESGTPIEAFRYRFTGKGVWRRSDGRKSVETAVPFEAVVWVETPVY